MDCARYFHKATGISGVAKIAKDLGASADPRKLAKAAIAYENSAVRRLGYLLDHSGHLRQAKMYTKDAKWMLMINEPVEIDY